MGLRDQHPAVCGREREPPFSAHPRPPQDPPPDNAIHIAALKKSGFSIACDERHNGSHFKFAEEASAGNWLWRSRSRNDVVAKEGQAGSAAGKTAKGKAKKGAKPARKPQRCKLCGESGHNAATCKNSKSRQRLLAAKDALYAKYRKRAAAGSEDASGAEEGPAKRARPAAPRA